MNAGLYPYSEDNEVQSIASKVLQGERLLPDEGLRLYAFPLGVLAHLANEISIKLNQGRVYYVRNFHIEPTNKCAYHCLFCSYSGVAGIREAWTHTPDEIIALLEEADPLAKEIHITGGAHPDWIIEDYCALLKIVRERRPEIHIKAFSAVEIHHLHTTSGITYKEILSRLKQHGLNSLPGGGAEIFAAAIRTKICPEKADATAWLSVHRTAHELGIPSNATMLYGHVESYADRIDHMNQLRLLQDETHGFNAFIPLKFRNSNNRMSQLSEVTLIEDLRNYAVARIYLDNFAHIKAYWPMLGKQSAAHALNFGVDDLDGTIQDSTRIYTMAGVDEKPGMTADAMHQLIKQSGKYPVERDALYQAVK